MSDHCVFCKIIRKEIPANVIYEDEQVLAFSDIHPAAPIHVLVIPKLHIETVEDIPAGDPLVSLLTERAIQVSKQLNLREGYRLVVNNGDNGGQTVYHLHLHLLGGRFMAWPPG
jgi:histidine triad (HIT) family protein